MDAPKESAISAMPAEIELSDALYRKFRDLLAERTGIDLKQYKKYLVVHRLSRLVGPGRDYADFGAFHDALVAPGSDALMTTFINLLTTNYSYFFRDPVHFSILRDHLARAVERESCVRLWSAAASSGEEAYSMAITALDNGFDRHRDFKILATDISTRMLERAEEGVYPEDRVRKELRAEDERLWFDRTATGELRVRDRVRSLVSFRYLNLLSPFPFSRPMDVVFLRNVLIYFGKEEKELVLEGVWDCLKPGGLLVVGLSESLVGYRHRFAMERNSVYRKA